MGCDDRDVVRDELRYAAAALRFACDLGRARLDAGPSVAIARLPASTRDALASTLSPVLAEHRRLWPLRSRPGGLDASASWYGRLLNALVGQR